MRGRGEDRGAKFSYQKKSKEEKPYSDSTGKIISQ